MDFGCGEKVLVILHELPVPDHKMYLLVVVCGAQEFLNYKERV